MPASKPRAPADPNEIAKALSGFGQQRFERRPKPRELVRSLQRRENPISLASYQCHVVTLQTIEMPSCPVLKEAPVRNSQKDVRRATWHTVWFLVCHGEFLAVQPHPSASDSPLHSDTGKPSIR
jgi:hypothetical protein